MLKIKYSEDNIFTKMCLKYMKHENDGLVNLKDGFIIFNTEKDFNTLKNIYEELFEEKLNYIINEVVSKIKKHSVFINESITKLIKKIFSKGENLKMNNRIPVKMIEDIKTGIPKLAILCKITLLNGNVLAFSTSDKDIIYDGVLYSAENGITQSAQTSSSTLSVDTTDLEGMLNPDLFDEADIAGGGFNGSKYELYSINYEHTEWGAYVLDSGILGDLNTTTTGFKFELRSYTQVTDTEIGRIFMPSCDANLGDSRCRVDLNAYKKDGSVVSSDYNFFIIDTSRTEDDGWWNGGLIKFTTGDNRLLTCEIKSYIKSTGRIDFQANFPYKIKAGDQYIISPGCDKTISTCKSKYNNVINFRGTPQVPAPETLLSI